MSWNKRHGEILKKLFIKLDDNNIKYFILRNYEGLPNYNSSKDVDIIVDPKRIDEAKNILKNIYKVSGITYYYEVQFGHANCCHGINLKDKLAIQIDIIESYVSKGHELFTFNELYAHTTIYNNIRVLDKFFEGVMIFIYKQFGYSKPKLKDAYKEIIYNTFKEYPEFKFLINKLIGEDLTQKIFLKIQTRDFEGMLKHSNELTKKLRKYSFKKNPCKTIKNRIRFFIQKIIRIIFSLNKYGKTFAVMAPDGAGKTTFLDALVKEINYYFINDEDDKRCHVYHFRPELLPNLGALGEKAGIAEQDKDFTNPHRAKPANKISSFIRICYYWIDYVIGFHLFVRKDIQYDRFSIFDRYGYDLIVDPIRTKLNLPKWLRQLFVSLMPHPKIVFHLNASPETIFKRKQELSFDEIKRQNRLYDNLTSKNKRFVTISSEQHIDNMVSEAIKIILEKFTQQI